MQDVEQAVRWTIGSVAAAFLSVPIFIVTKTLTGIFFHEVGTALQAISAFYQ